MSTTERRRARSDDGPHLMTTTYRTVSSLRENPRNARTHTDRQIAQIAAAQKKFGYFSPVVIDETGEIICGHGRFLAAKSNGDTQVPTITLRGMSSEAKIALALADNKIPMNAGWDADFLAANLKFLSNPEIQLDPLITGFDTPEIDNLVFSVEEAVDEAADAIPTLSTGQPVTRQGDQWIAGTHSVICGSALDSSIYQTLMGREKARMVFTDPPYNVTIGGHVSGLGKRRHREFLMASGELPSDAFTEFLGKAMTLSAMHSVEGAIHYWCMDWRHLDEMSAAGRLAHLDLKNLIVWVKTNGGMGTFYRSQHELIFAYKKGNKPHLNNFGLGASGRYRTNVWEYPGVNTFGRNRDSELAAHPTPKPTSMIADAIKDVSHRGDIVLDSFGGSGSTLVAAERTQRRARLIELDPLYVDVIVRRWEAYTGETARHADTNQTFREVEIIRSESNVPR